MLKLNGLHLRADEGTVVAAATPGDILAPSGTVGWRPHPASGEGTPVIIAKEDSFIGTTIDDTYSVGSRIQVHHGQVGDEWYSRLATPSTVTAGAFLMSNGDGRLTVASGTGGVGIAKALEASTATGSAGTVRLRARVIGGPKTF